MIERIWIFKWNGMTEDFFIFFLLLWTNSTTCTGAASMLAPSSLIVLCLTFFTMFLNFFSLTFTLSFSVLSMKETWGHFFDCDDKWRLVPFLGVGKKIASKTPSTPRLLLSLHLHSLLHLSLHLCSFCSTSFFFQSSFNLLSSLLSNLLSFLCSFFPQSIYLLLFLLLLVLVLALLSGTRFFYFSFFSFLSLSFLFFPFFSFLSFLFSFAFSKYFWWGQSHANLSTHSHHCSLLSQSTH